MKKISLPSVSRLKNFLSGATLTGGFALIAVGFGRIFGAGVGMITAGVLLVILQWWAFSSE